MSTKIQYLSSGCLPSSLVVHLSPSVLDIPEHDAEFCTLTRLNSKLRGMSAYTETGSPKHIDFWSG